MHNQGPSAPARSAGRFTAACLAVFVLLATLGFASPRASAAGATNRLSELLPARIFVANKIITMDPARPTATAVAVENGEIVAVGTLGEVLSALRGRWQVVDRTFANQIIVPGFVEAHSHFQAYGLYSRVPYLGYFDRPGPDGTVLTGVTNLTALLARLQSAVSSQVRRTRQPHLPVLAFGADPIFYTNEIGGNHFTTRILDRVSTNTPIFLPLLSGHAVACNTPMLKLIMAETNWNQIKDTPAVLKYADTGEPSGELDEIAASTIAFAAFQKADPRFFPTRGLPALRDAAGLAHRAGVTTVTDLAFGAEPGSSEQIARAFYVLATANPQFPLRIVLGYFVDNLNHNWSNAVSHLQSVRRTDTNKLRTGPVKIITDGSIQGYTAQLQPPGFWDPSLGNPIWNVNPGQELFDLCLPFWQAGFQLAAHVNGDEATEQMLDVLEALQTRYPQADHRFSLQHNQLSHPDQFARMARLGATVNLFCNHIYYYGDQHRDITLGPERASLMDSPAMAKAAGVPFSIHSDAPVTPLQPLTAIWCAVNRVTASGRVLDNSAASQKITVQDALQAVTLGAAYLLKLEHEIGSIEPGKRADFTVLGQDPYVLSSIEIRNIPVKATVFNWTVFPVR
jgi:predicted amidohydrolase YtcJ